MNGGPSAGGEAETSGAAGVAALGTHLEHLLRQAQARLVRIARSYGIAGDEADDVVQETQIRAWRQLRQLRSAERFDAWLDAICRNECRMHLRTRKAAYQHTASLPEDVAHPARDLLALAAAAAGERELLPSGLAGDPCDELERQELADLIDRALGHLPAQARTALELRYYHGWTLAEIASSLDASLAAQEIRLRRARTHLRDTLLGPLRHEAAAFGLVDPARAPDDGGVAWQTTRITCYLCGRRSLEGRFEPGANGRRELRLRCPACTRQHGVDVFRSKGLAPLDGVRAFRPALTRAMRALEAHGRRALSSGCDVCLHCGTAVQRKVVTADAYPDALPPSSRRHWLVAHCPRAGCPGLGPWAAAEPVLWSTPAARQFMACHPRWVLDPEDEGHWEERPAILLHMADRDSGARLTVVVDAGTLGALATFKA